MNSIYDKLLVDNPFQDIVEIFYPNIFLEYYYNVFEDYYGEMFII